MAMSRLTYSELISHETFEERYRYLRIGGQVGKDTFGFNRYLNQVFYRSPEWRSFRREIILRDNGCDLGIADREIIGRIYIHHINPITLEDISKRSSSLFDPENVITVSMNTHQAIHYGDESLLILNVPERSINDTSPWRL